MLMTSHPGYLLPGPQIPTVFSLPVCGWTGNEGGPEAEEKEGGRGMAAGFVEAELSAVIVVDEED
jgi:hypothetical protein